MGRDRVTEDLELFLAERGRPLLRTAMLLTGSREAGEDLLQAGLERLLRHWNAIEGSPEPYLRKILYHLASDGRGGYQGRARPAAPATAAGAARGHRAALLGAALGSRGRRDTWLLDRHRQVRYIQRARAATRAESVVEQLDFRVR
jgi:DNA-directed RNA polymerase specialized sigma24 family protein